MANSFEQAFEQLSDEQLRQAFEEYVRWRETATVNHPGDKGANGLNSVLV